MEFWWFFKKNLGLSPLSDKNLIYDDLNTQIFVFENIKMTTTENKSSQTDEFEIWTEDSEDERENETIACEALVSQTEIFLTPNPCKREVLSQNRDIGESDEDIEDDDNDGQFLDALELEKRFIDNEARLRVLEEQVIKTVRDLEIVKVWRDFIMKRGLLNK